MATVVKHHTGQDWVDHLAAVSGGFMECWCIERCCQRPQAPGGLPVCVCPDCCCDNDEYWDQFEEGDASA